MIRNGIHYNFSIDRQQLLKSTYKTWPGTFFYVSVLIVMPQYAVTTILPEAILEKGIKSKCYKVAISFPPGQTLSMSPGISPNQTFYLENPSHFNRCYPIEKICDLLSILSTIQQQESGLI